MSEFKGTPGDWSIDGSVNKTDIVVGNEEYQIAICLTHPNIEQTKANAHLIAAAPELFDCNLELANIVREMCRCLKIPLPEASLARSDAAIAKALGKQL